MDSWIEPVATILSVGGALLITSLKAKTRVTAFSLWIIANLLWFSFAINQNLLFQSIMWIIYTLTAVCGFFKNLIELKAKR